MYYYLTLRRPTSAVQFLTLNMPAITFSRLSPTDSANIKLIAHWYLNEWSIPPKDTIQSLSNLIYTSKGQRQKGLGSLLCKKIDEMAKAIGVKEMFLYTQTAESMYRKLGWSEMERIQYKGEDTVVMHKKY